MHGHEFRAVRERALDLISALPPEVTRDAMLLLANAPAGARSEGPLAPLLNEALRLLATRVAAVGLSDVIAQRGALGSLEMSPFYQLPRVIDGVLSQSHSSDDAGLYYAAFLLDPDGNNVEAVSREF